MNDIIASIHGFLNGIFTQANVYTKSSSTG